MIPAPTDATLELCNKLLSMIGVREYGPNSRNWSLNDRELLLFVSLLHNADAMLSGKGSVDETLKYALAYGLPWLSHAQGPRAGENLNRRYQIVSREPGVLSRCRVVDFPTLNDLVVVSSRDTMDEAELVHQDISQRYWYQFGALTIRENPDWVPNADQN